MFHNFTPEMLERMSYLENLDTKDRLDGTPQEKRLRQVSPETGRLLALLAAASPPGERIEIGTSAGYSSLWIGLACRAEGRVLKTFETSSYKRELARETFRLTNTSDVIQLVPGDARQHLAKYDHIGFCFLDAEKDVYAECYDLVVDRLVPGGILAVDNVVSHQQPLQSWLNQVRDDERGDSVILPIGNGVLVWRTT